MLAIKNTIQKITYQYTALPINNDVLNIISFLLSHSSKTLKITTAIKTFFGVYKKINYPDSAVLLNNSSMTDSIQSIKLKNIKSITLLTEHAPPAHLFHEALWERKANLFVSDKTTPLILNEYLLTNTLNWHGASILKLIDKENSLVYL